MALGVVGGTFSAGLALESELRGRMARIRDALIVALGLLALLISGPSHGQSALNGMPWVHGETVITGYPCGPTMSAVECANDYLAQECARANGYGVFCNNTPVDCAATYGGSGSCNLAVGQYAVSLTAGQAELFVSTHANKQNDAGRPCPCVGDPINPANGNMYLEENDIPPQRSNPQSGFSRFYNTVDPDPTMAVGWRYSFSRRIEPIVMPQQYESYSSSDPQDSNTSSTPDWPCIYGWGQIRGTSAQWSTLNTSYSNGVCSLVDSSGNVVANLPIYNAVHYFNVTGGTPSGYTAVRDSGQTVSFTITASELVAPTGSALRLTQTATGFQLIDDDDNVEIYNAAGQLLSITSRSGITESLSYDSSNRLSTITDSFGRQLTLGYNAQNQLSSVTDPASGAVQYGYDSQNRLSTVINLDSTSRTYVYEDTSFPNYVTGVIDENNVRYSTWGYNAAGQATSSQAAVGANAATVAYNGNGTVTATDALGAVRTFSFNQIGTGYRNLVVATSGSRCATCSDVAATTYDSNGWVASETDYNGNVVCYANDPVRGLELVRVEGFAPGSSCPANLASYVPSPGTTQRKISTTWHATYRLPTLITEPSRTTSFLYDSSGNLKTKTVTDTTVTPNVSRIWAYTYNNYGQVLTAKGPRTDVDTTITYTYYTCTTGVQCGQINTVTDALGHVTTFNTYSAYGNPLTLTDPNGVGITLAYDARQRVTSRSVGGETTSVGYYPTGLVHLVTHPDGSFLSYTYDGAHRLTRIQDGLGNSISYTLDLMGNKTVENVYDPSNTLVSTHSSPYNTLSELYQDIGSAGTSAVTTTYGYDSNGNLHTVNAPLSRNSTYNYDPLNRLAQVTDPANGVATLSYDTDDHVTSVTDPLGLITGYHYDGFGDFTQQVSPDTGTTTNTFDSGGNTQTSTDARGAVATYTYDALNRITQTQYAPPAGSNIAAVTNGFTYDNCTNGAGRVCQVTDSSGSTSWTYTPQGRVSTKTQTFTFDSTTGSTTRTTGYQYTNGLLTTLDMPSGIVVGYSYNAAGRISGITVIQPGGGLVTLLSNVTYDFLGNVTGWTWGNGTTAVRAFDLDSRISTINSAGATVYGYDNANRLNSATSQSGNPSPSWTYGYDALDHLNSAQQPAQSLSYTYDANGNRLTQGGTTSSTYGYASSPASNRLTSVTTGSTTQSYAYDASGNLTSDGTVSYIYDASGRLTNAATTAYDYNALGQRVGKSHTPGVDIYYTYDEQGHVLEQCGFNLGVCDAGTLQTYIWLADIPVGSVLLQYQTNSDGSTTPAGLGVFYVHSDQLGTPRRLTNSNDATNTVVWRLDTEPFGFGAEVGSPTTFDLRFPGQLYDSETGKSYNYFRDYDPATGRYVESDPIGLAGGSFSTYAYVNASPLTHEDFLGLCPKNPKNPKCKRLIMQAKYTQIFGQMGRDLGINPLFIMSTALQESGWDLVHVYGTNSSSHGQPLNNLFGATYGGHNNIAYPNVQASALAWEQNWGPYLSTPPQTIQGYAQDLTKNPHHMYNSDPAYPGNLADRYAQLVQAVADCGADFTPPPPSK